MSDFYYLDASTIAKKIHSRAISSVEVTQQLLTRIKALSHLGAFVTVTAERALADAARGSPCHRRYECVGHFHHR